MDGTTGKHINYLKAGANAFTNFLKGGENYPKVDLSLWDQATMCATCHVGGVFYEQDREGNRLPAKTMDDWGPALANQSNPPKSLNPITATVWENYDATTGQDKSFVAMSPWVYPVYMGRGGAPDPKLPNGGPMVVPNGLQLPAGVESIQMPDNNGGAPYTVVAGQLMMPNVKEMDCLFCHLKGYDNVMASVMVQAGSLSATPTTGAGLFDMFSLSPTFMGYDPMNGKTAFYRIGKENLPPAFVSYSSHEAVFLTAKVTDNIKGKPDSDNCHQCHATKTLKNFPEMFGVTGGSTGFLSSAPMVYDPNFGVGPLGKRMVNYDINAPFLRSGTSDVIDGSNYMNNMMSGLSYLAANGPTPFNLTKLGNGIGGGNEAMSGPLYYYPMVPQDPTHPKNVDQNTLKKSTMPFPRAEWFKRGDAWQTGKDVHASFGCAGCHFTGNSTDKNMCDPARGFDAASTIQDGLPAFKERAPVADKDLNGNSLSMAQTIKNHDTRNTVKRCEFCHLTGTDYKGNAIDTFGAPNPTSKHTSAGLLANVTQIVDKMALHGDFGGKGVPRASNFTTNDTETKVNGVVTATNPGGTILGRGNHLDVMDCTVCHVMKETMAVRSLDASSGMRFPAIVGTDPSKGMLGLFEDPSGMRAVMTPEEQTANQIPGGDLKQWEPVVMWQPYGNMELPLSTANTPNTDLKFRRKLYLTNPITAVLWNNEGTGVDANGDGVPGGLLIGDLNKAGDHHIDADGKDITKPSLRGYRDIFTGDVPDANNTSGFEKPIFDPWAMRDLKSGFNFGPAPLSVISVGFGGFGTPAGKTDTSGGLYASLYDQNGMFANDKWKYASVWSGAVVFTEPDQIREYKKYRTSISSATDGKSWDDTTLTLIGAPFMVTHGIQPTATYAKGKNGCTDCHAANKGFFKGSFDMIGPSIPATISYNTGTYPEIDRYGNIVLDAQGEPKRGPAVGMNMPPNMMARPLEPVRIKAFKGDLTGYFEGYNKLGQPREINFVHDVTIQETDGPKDYSYASTIDRADIIYPAEDGAIYYKIGDISADGVPSGSPVNGAAYATYLEDSTKFTAAGFGIGVDPKATINLPLVDDSATQSGVQWATGSFHSVSAAYAQPNATTNPTGDAGTVTYTWSTNDNAEITNANSRDGAQIKFTTTGSKVIKLTVTDEEGKSSSTFVSLTAIAPPMTIGWAKPTATFSNLPAGTYTVNISWGDGTSTLVKNANTIIANNTLTQNHTYTSTTSKIVKIYCYSSTGSSLGYTQATINPAL
ncbi:hypothetical protein [Geomonas anaerohicana]|uniref:PKD domain-containing protein n=1 Tax=Geomonas anaerohicana TaxID=2798583 RepID=A0ABS0YGS3_9BACT|nr:hypothetical protein [Geomonas anaerohicana]MBJ6751527.1 hypothetical protein [Geomonas anaerohicana]